jgi:hypothetical protein
VRVVEHKRSKKLYALKYIDKTRCIRQKAVANIIQERRLLEEVSFHCPNPLYACAYHRPGHRLIILSLLICGTLSRTMRIVSSSWISCLEEICDVCHTICFSDHLRV